MAGTKKNNPTRFSARLRGDYQECLEVIVEARLAAQLSQAQVAERLGVAQSWIAKAETGVRRIDFLEFVQIAEAVDSDPSELLNRVVERLHGARPTRRRK